MKQNLSLTAVCLFPFLILGLACKMNEYPNKNKCCKLCSPGEQLVERCTMSLKTVCEPCEENYYNDVFTYSRCKRCTTCDHDRGLQEVTPCQRTSNTICACLPGHSLENGGSSEDENRCKPCPTGYFSRGGNERCQPWTNCTARGRKTLHPGRADADSICNDSFSEPPKGRLVTLPTSLNPGHGRGVLSTTLFSTQADLAKNEGFGWVLVVIVLLLSVAGGSLLAFAYWRVKGEKARIPCKVIWLEPDTDEGQSYQVPIQEEQIKSQSDFI